KDTDDDSVPIVKRKANQAVHGETRGNRWESNRGEPAGVNRRRVASLAVELLRELTRAGSLRELPQPRSQSRNGRTQLISSFPPKGPRTDSGPAPPTP